MPCGCTLPRREVFIDVVRASSNGSSKVDHSLAWFERYRTDLDEDERRAP